MIFASFKLDGDLPLQTCTNYKDQTMPLQTLSLHGRQANCLFMVAPRFGPTGPMKQAMQTT